MDPDIGDFPSAISAVCGAPAQTAVWKKFHRFEYTTL